MAFNASFPWLRPSEVRSDNSPDDAVPNLKHLLNSGLPFYLSPKYHLSLLHTDSSDGNFFGHAAQLILHNEVHGLHFWKEVSANFLGADKEVPKNSGFLSHETRRQVFGKRLDECPSARQFLLEPCVIMQLPHFPVVLYQWLSAALLEYQRVRLQSTFLQGPIPESVIDAALSLMRFLMRLFNLIDCGFTILGEQLEKFPEKDENLTMLIRNLLVPTLLPLLETLLEPRTIDLFCLNIKRRAELRFGKERHLLINCKFNRCWSFEEGRVYLPEFWFDKCKTGSLFGPTLKGSIPHIIWQMDFAELVVKDATENLLINLKTKTNEDITMFKAFVRNNILNTKMVTGVQNGYLDDNFYSLKCIQTGASKHALERHLQNLFGSFDGHLDWFIQSQIDINKQIYIEGIANYVVLYCRQRGKEVQLRTSREPDQLLTTNAMCYHLANAVSRHPISVKELFGKRRSYRQFMETTSRHRQNMVILEILMMHIAPLLTDFHKSIIQGKVNDSTNWLWIQYFMPCIASSVLTASRISHFKEENLDKLLKLAIRIIESYRKEWNNSPEKEIRATVKQENQELMTEKAQKVINMWSRLKFEINLLIFDQFTYNAKFEGIPGLRHLEKVFCEVFFSVNDIHPCMQDILAAWSDRQQVFLLKLLQAVRAEEMEKATSSNLKELLMVHNFLEHTAWHMKPEDSSRVRMQHVFWLLNYVHKKLHCLKRKLSTNSFKEKFVGEQRVILEEAGGLSFRNIFHLILFHLCEAMKLELVVNKRQFFLTTSFLSEDTRRLTTCFIRKDWARLKMLLMPILGGQKRHMAASNLQVHEIESKLPLLGRYILSKIRDGKLILRKPGEMTIAPLAHCRWCGQVEGSLQICYWCNEFQDYPDLTWYCSEQCQNLSLELDHKEEHARFIIILLDIPDPGPH